jgi:hypothetical protein
MNLQENYKRLFKGRIRSNDLKLIKEEDYEGLPTHVEEIEAAYDRVYGLTDEYNDEPLEVLDDYVGQSNLNSLFDRFYDDDRDFSPTDAKKMIDVMNDVVGEFN